MNDTVTIQIPKDVRLSHLIITTILGGLPSELPFDIRVTPTKVTRNDPKFGPYRLIKIKLIWPGSRVEATLRKYTGADKTSIEDVIVRQNRKGARKGLVSKAELALMQAEYWTS